MCAVFTYSDFTNLRLFQSNSNTYVVIGAGLPRTGTASLRSALNILLDGPIYHMFEVFKNGSEDRNFWSEASAKNKPKEEWKNFLEGRGYRGGVDFPHALFYR